MHEAVRQEFVDAGLRIISEREKRDQAALKEAEETEEGESRSSSRGCSVLLPLFDAALAREGENQNLVLPANVLYSLAMSYRCLFACSPNSCDNRW